MIPALLLLAANPQTPLGWCAGASSVTTDIVSAAAGRDPVASDKMLAGTEMPNADAPDVQLYIYIRGRDMWAGHPVGDADQLEADFTTRAGWRLFIGSRNPSKSNGDDRFDGVIFNRTAKLVSCFTIPTPLAPRLSGARPQSIQQMRIVKIGYDTSRRLRIDAEGVVGRDGRTKKLNLRFFSSDGGRTWSRPVFGIE